MDNEKYIIMLQETTDKANRNEERIKKLENENEDLHQLATSVAVMAEQMKGLNQNVTTLRGEVEEIKEKPAKRYDTIVTAIITGLISALVGFVVGGLL
jgi:predicted nuclease with TOPRIM domain